MEQTNNEEPKVNIIKPRNGFIAFILSLLFPGLGQVYNGQPKKAILFFSLILLIPILFGLSRVVTSFEGLLLLLVIQIAFSLYIIIDAVYNAMRQKEYVLKSYNTWYYHLLIAIGMFAIMMVYDIGAVLGVQTFKLPNPSNMPTFQVGDLVIADMRAYQNNKPDYGDIIVYSRPDGQIYTFRVVGLPNDTVDLIDNIVSVNGKPGKATFVKEAVNNGLSILEYEEELPNGHKHLIYKNKHPYDSTKTNIKNIIVPPDSYYLLGDNRDIAADSRYEGFVGEYRIKGRIVYSYMGQTPDRINIDFRNK